MKAPLRVLVLRSFRSPLQAVGSLAFFLLTVLSILILILIPRFVAPLRIPYLPLQMAEIRAALFCVLALLGAGIFYRFLESIVWSQSLNRDESPVFASVLVMVMTVLFFAGCSKTTRIKLRTRPIAN